MWGKITVGKDNEKMGLEMMLKICYSIFVWDLTTEQIRTKYVHFVNSTKTGVKTLIIRIFCELHSESCPGAQYLWGFQKGAVEMDVARFRALTHPIAIFFRQLTESVEMDVARFRALTQFHGCNASPFC